jgi:phosphatidylglycerophosphate synthase
MTFTFESISILVASILIISREIAVSYLRLFIISNYKENREVQPDLIGKLKTAIQMVGIGGILITPIFPYFFFNLSLSFIFLGAFFSWYSFFRYLRKWLT